MPRPIARVLQEFQNAVVTSTEPVLKTVIVGPHKHVREYPENKASILSDRIGSDIEALMTSSGSSPTIAAVIITAYPDNIIGAIPIDASVKIYIEGYAEVASEADGLGDWRQNIITTAGDLTAISENDRVVLNPTGVQVFEDLNNNFSTAGIVPGTDVLLIGAAIHNIDEVQSEHRLIVKAAVSGVATLGFFAAADGAATTAYTIGDNGPGYDNKIAAGTTGQRLDWRRIYLFNDDNTDFEAAGVVAGHFLTIGASVHYIESVIGPNHLEVRRGTTLVSPQNRGEFAASDGAANIAYGIGTQNGAFKDVVDNTLTGTGQRLASDSVVRYVFSVDSPTQFSTKQFLPFAGTGAAPLNFRVEHLVADSNKPAGSDGWQPSIVSVNPTTKAITVGPDGVVTYAAGSRRVIDAQMYVEYQSLRQDTTAEVAEVTSNDIDALLGEDRTENSLRRGAGIAVANAGVTKIHFLALASDDQTGHTAAQGILANDKGVYAIVPLTQTGSILQSYKAHVLSMSDPTRAKRRILLCQAGTLPTTKTITSAKTDGTAESAITLFSPATDFSSDGVVPGDTVVLSSPTTNTYTVASVLSGNRLTISGAFTGPEQAATGAVAFTVTRALTKSGQATELATIPTGFGDRRVVLVWPDTCTIGTNTTEPGYYLACALGGMIAALPSHRMTTKIGVAAIDEISNSNGYFDDDQINALIDAGYYMFEQESVQAAPFTSQQYTTVGVTADPRDRFLSAVKNFDYVTSRFQSVVDEFPGEWNIIEDLFGAVEDSVSAEASRLIADKRPKIGSPLLRLTDLRVEPSATLSDKIEVYGKAQLPNILDKLDFHLISV